MKVSENLSILFMIEKPEMSKDGLIPIDIRISICSQRKEISLKTILRSNSDYQKGISKRL